MTDEEKAQQQRIHDVLEDVLHEQGDLPDGDLLTGWVVCFETATLSSERKATAGHFYGPEGMTTWRAMGLVEWSKCTLDPYNDRDD